MLSKREIDEYIAFIGDALDGLGAGDGDLSRCMEVHERFSALRDQYRQQPDSLGEHTTRLSELSKRFDDLLTGRLPLIVDRFNEVNEQIRLVQQEKAFWRDFLIRRAVQARQGQLNGTLATVRVRSTQSRTLPPVGSSERSQLEDLIRDSGRWEQVSQLSRPKLQRALAGSVFAGEEAAAIEYLCPSTETYQVSSRALDER